MPFSDGESSPTNYYNSAASSSRMETSDAILAKMATRASLTADSAKLILAMVGLTPALTLSLSLSLSLSLTPALTLSLSLSLSLSLTPALYPIQVGLPARGKSFISHKLYAFLNWSGTRTQIFNAGQKRRLAEPEDSQAVAAAEGPRPMQRERSAASFFDPTDPDAKAAREEIAMETLDELLRWFEAGGEVGIYDATNPTLARRAEVLARAAAASERAGHSVNVVFIESICDEAALLEANMLAKVRASPDFRNLSEEEALADLRERIGHYERAYESVTDEEGAYIKLYNLSSKVSANQVFGRMSTRVLPYLAALHIRDRPVYLAALLPGDASLPGSPKKR